MTKGERGQLAMGKRVSPVLADSALRYPRFCGTEQGEAIVKA
jgi:hypothetical protein